MAKTPETVAVVYEGQSFTYRQLNRAADALACRLQALRLGPDALVAILSERSPELVIGMVAVLKAGGAYLPLDPAHPAERLRFILEDAKPAAVLVQGMCCNFVVEPKVGVDDRQFSSPPRTDRE